MPCARTRRERRARKNADEREDRRGGWRPRETPAQGADTRGHAGLRGRRRSRFSYAGTQAGARRAPAAPGAHHARGAARGSLAHGGARRSPRADDVHQGGGDARGGALRRGSCLSHGERHDGRDPRDAARHALARRCRARTAQRAPLAHRRARARGREPRLSAAGARRGVRHPDGRRAGDGAARARGASRGARRRARLSDVLRRDDGSRGHCGDGARTRRAAARRRGARGAFALF